MMSRQRQDILWPPAGYTADQMQFEIAQANREARRIAARRRRENRRWWIKTLAVVAVFAAAAWFVIWMVSGQVLPPL